MDRILFIDDDPRYSESLVVWVYEEYGLRLELYDNLEDAISKWDDNPEEYQGIIIDGKGRLTKDSKGDDPSHLKEALKKISERKGKGKYMP